MTKTSYGLNRTGIEACPDVKDDLIAFAQAVMPSSPGGPEDAGRIREEYTRDAEPIGSVPVPAAVQAGAKAAAPRVRPPSVLIDKIGERLAFERSGTRLYELLIQRLDALGTFAGGPTRADLEAIRRDEMAHFDMLRTTLEGLGGDPTAMTPSADVIGVASMGLFQVIAEPRTTLAHGLQALLVAELADRDSWGLLIELAEGLGEEEMASKFRAAEQAEERHLALVRRWVSGAHQAELQAEVAGQRP